MTPLTLKHLTTLCACYVPRVARSAGFKFDRRRASFWPAHEIGHLLTTEPWRHKTELFGLDIDSSTSWHESACRELAAMSVSRRLLAIVGRDDLYRMELRYTDSDTLNHSDRGRVKQLLRRFKVQRLPTTFEGLERLLKERTQHAPKASRTRLA